MIKDIVIYCQYGETIGLGHQARSRSIYDFISEKCTEVARIKCIEHYEKDLSINQEVIAEIDWLIVDCTNACLYMMELMKKARYKVLVSPVFYDEVEFDYALLSCMPPENTSRWKSKKIVKTAPFYVRGINKFRPRAKSRGVNICFSGGAWFPRVGWHIIEMSLKLFDKVNVVSTNHNVAERLHSEYKELIESGNLSYFPVCNIRELRAEALYFIGGTGLMMEQAILDEHACLSVVNCSTYWKFSRYANIGVLCTVFEDDDPETVREIFAYFGSSHFREVDKSLAKELWSGVGIMEENLLNIFNGVINADNC